MLLRRSSPANDQARAGAQELQEIQECALGLGGLREEGRGVGGLGEAGHGSRGPDTIPRPGGETELPCGRQTGPAISGQGVFENNEQPQKPRLGGNQKGMPISYRMPTDGSGIEGHLMKYSHHTNSKSNIHYSYF